MKFLSSAFFRRLFPVFLFLMATSYANGQNIRGTVLDAITGEPMIGATVVLKENNLKQLVRLDGTFMFKNVKPGAYHLEITFTNFTRFEQQINHIATENTLIAAQLLPSSANLSEVTVTAGKSEKNIRLLEKNSNQLVNIVSAKTIQLLPDITVANVLQRISGVVIEKTSSGEGRYPIIRGMEKRYINTLVNGVKIPSPDNKNRFIPLDLFPSELLERLEVSKSLTPSMEGDAIGGTINLVMKDAPVNKLLQINFSTGYNNIFASQPFLKFDKGTINKQSPNQINGPAYAANVSEFSVGHLHYKETNNPVNTTFGVSVGNRFGKDKKIGVIASASYQSQFRGTKTSLFSTATTP